MTAATTSTARRTPPHIAAVIAELVVRDIAVRPGEPTEWIAERCPKCDHEGLLVRDDNYDAAGRQRKARLLCEGCHDEAGITRELGLRERDLTLASAAPTRRSRLGSDPDEFFDGPRFVPSRLGERLRDEFPTALGGARLYAYADGTYQPAGQLLQRRVTELLGEHWRTRCSMETLAYLAQSSGDLWERPPLDRIAVANGILSIPDRIVDPPSPAFRSPVRISAAFNPEATCPRIDSFLDAVFPDGAELLHQMFGHLMVPDTSRQKAFMLLGPGGNGKSTVLALLRAFLGATNLSAVSLHDLEDNRFATADLYGKLANIYADLDARSLASTGIFKSITGGDPIRAERKNKDPFAFVPYARLVFSANDPPATRDSSTAFFDRWEIIPFQRRLRGTVEERDQEQLLREMTTPEELSGLLNRALDGLELLRSTGRFVSTAAVEGAAVEFRRTVDSVAAFLEEECTVAPGHRETRAMIRRAYATWCTDNGRNAVATQRLYRRIREIHPEIEDVMVDGERFIAGLKLGSA